MPVPAAEEMLNFLTENGFLPAQVLPFAGADSAAVLADARTLARELVDRDLLTPYQANQLLQGRGDELLLGPYRILDRLGEGGMGQVFKAHHTSMDRTIALKVIPKDRVCDPTAVARFYREVRAVAKLSHPNIVTAFEVNQVGDTHFLAMEYVGGIDLARLVRQSGPLSIPNACEYIRQAAVGLQHAHEKGLVHRDIKPGNLIVARPNPDELPVVKILDFGLARFESERTPGERLTQLGKIMGTVDYIAPEQAQNARTADIRADIFSLGCSLFFLLTGRPPFEGKDATEKIGARLLANAPSVREFRPEVSPALERVLAKMMARNPADRYQTPGEVAKALEPYAEKSKQTQGKPGPVPVIPVAYTAKTEMGQAVLPTQLASAEIQRASRSQSDQGAGARRPVVVIAAVAFVAGSVLALLAAGGLVFWLNRNGDSSAPNTQAVVKKSGTEGPAPQTKTQPKTESRPGPDKTVTAKDSKQPILDKKPDSKKEEKNNPSGPAEIHPTTWNILASMPTARSLLAAVTGPDGRIYAIGGENTSGRLDTVEVYNTSTNKWDSAAPMPTARNHLAATVGPDNLIYAIGGVSSNPKIVEAYNPKTNVTVQAAGSNCGAGWPDR
jgi:serine/threonine-protein kinase